MCECIMNRLMQNSERLKIEKGLLCSGMFPNLAHGESPKGSLVQTYHRPCRVLYGVLLDVTDN